ncbi:MAG: efflux RND transporter periplasmic adaptor subunit [Phycisphaerae bacterium]
MTTLRTTFSESWHKVADLSPRLRTTVHVYRQQFRGRTWHVARDSANNQHFRLNEPGYYFMALLDGRRRVADAWTLCNDRLGDDAPTQNEVVELLGRLYAANLLYCELPGDSEVLFRRYRKRIKREIQGRLSSILFAKIPLFNPNHLLNRWVWLFGRAFTWYGGGAVCALLILGLVSLAGHWEALQNHASGVLSQDNLPWLYVCFVLTKVFHEFGHAFACKRFGRLNGTGGDVHEMGIMLLVFTPVPYVDASSAWTFRSKWQRIVVGAAGILAEFALAGVAALVWTNTSQGTLTNALAYNVLFISGVSTLLFNVNPLLRYDGYYILSDLLEIPNLATRSRRYIYYLVKRYLWGLKSVVHPCTAREHGWLFFYAVTSTIYRTIVAVAIILFIADKLFFLGAILAMGAVVTMGLVPLFTLIHYLATSGELARVRRRAVGTISAMVGGTACAMCLIPVPDHLRAEGVVEPRRIAIVHARADGFIRRAASSGSAARPGEATLVEADNAQLVMELSSLFAERRGTEVRRRWALRDSDMAAVQVFEEQTTALDDQITRKHEELASLAIYPPFAGTWISPGIENRIGAYVRRGEPIGMVADLTDFCIRATADQYTAAILVSDARPEVEIRARSRPDIQWRGTITEIYPAGQEQLPAQSLSIFAGGSVETKADDPTGRKAAEPFFEVRIEPAGQQFFYAGQRVVVRFALPAKPLALQWWRSIEQLIQKRFRL